MLRERKARSCKYDSASGTALLEVSSGGGQARDVEGTVLFDGHGAIVGVDVEPGGTQRTVVLLGAHEDVRKTQTAKLSVSRDAQGEITSVVVTGVAAPV